MPRHVIHVKITLSGFVPSFAAIKSGHDWSPMPVQCNTLLYRHGAPVMSRFYCSHSVLHCTGMGLQSCPDFIAATLGVKPERVLLLSDLSFFKIMLSLLFASCISASADSRRTVVIHWQKYVVLVLITRLGSLSLPRNSIVRLTGLTGITIAVYRGQQTTSNNMIYYLHMSPNVKAEPFIRMICVQVFLPMVTLKTVIFYL